LKCAGLSPKARRALIHNSPGVDGDQHWSRLPSIRWLTSYQPVLTKQRRATVSIIMNLIDTDPLAKFALGGLVVTLVVTIALFGFLVTRHDGRA
jgi:hypothetical protein